MPVTVERQDYVSYVTFDNPPMNLMTIDVIKDLIDAHLEADAQEKSRVIVTRSAAPGIFSNGLDPAYVIQMEPAARVAIFDWVGRMLHSLFSLGKPHVAIINGPAMAGGAILAITADFRVFDVEHGRLSFSEPKVGLPIPEAVSSVIGHFCPPNALRDVVLLGKNMDAEAALQAGLADALAPTDQLGDTAGKLIERLARLSPAVMRATKHGLRRRVLEVTEAMQAGRDDAFRRFVGDAFLGEGLRALVERRFPNFTE